MTNSFADYAKAKMIILVGTNITEAHPVASTFVKDAVLAGAKLIVIDPRRTDMVDFAEMHVPLKVGSDVALINGVMNVLIEENLYDKKYVDSCTEGFEDLKKKVMEYPPERAAEISGIPADTIRELARKMASVKPAMLMYTLGITEHYQQVANADARAKFAKAWNVKSLPDKPGMMMPTMMKNLTTGKVKAFYVFGENLANTEPDIHHVERELQSAEFLVCQDIFPTETTRFAHVILPAAAWSENDGTFASSERRVNRVRAASVPPGDARPNWWIFKELAKRFGHEWQSSSAQEIWDNEISVLAPSMAGIKYARLENDGLQWPCPTEDHPGTPTLHKGGKFTRGLGMLKAIDYIPPAEVPDQEYPFVLSTGRRLYHYHTRTQTGRSAGINDLLGEETADISTADAEAKGISDGEKISVKSRRGEVVVKARVTKEVPPGLVWMAFHFREACANWLTNPVYDPVTQTAEYKACAVRIDKLR